jgi:hypothetical protein
MELLLHQLEQNLSQTVEVYEDLLEVSRSKQEAIVCADIEWLEQTVKAEGELIETAQRVETVRLRIHYAIAYQMGIAPEELNIEKLMGSWAFHETACLKKVHGRLKAVIEELKAVNAMNNYLADTSLKLLNELRRAVLRPGEDQTFYGRSGEVEHPAHELMLVDVAG